MTEIKIDFDKPLPTHTRGTDKGISATLVAMPAPNGDLIASVFFPEMTARKLGGNFSSVRMRYPAFADAKFTVRSVTENGVKGVRVWRIK